MPLKDMEKAHPEVFEYSSDISFLHGAVISCHRQVSSTADNVLRLVTKEAFSKTISTITETVKAVSNGLGFQRWSIENSDCVNRRMHAALLYNSLQSTGLSDRDMDLHYESIGRIFPKFGLDIYLELVKSCSWGKYYIELVGALPEQKCLSVLWSTLEHCSFGTTCEDCYLIHSVLQVAVRKVFEQCFDRQADFPVEQLQNDYQGSTLTENKCKQTHFHDSQDQLLYHIKEAFNEDGPKKTFCSVLHYAIDFLIYYWKLCATSSSGENSSSRLSVVKSVLHTLLTFCDLVLEEYFIDKWDLSPVYISKCEEDQIYSIYPKNGTKTSIEHVNSAIQEKSLSNIETWLTVLHKYDHFITTLHLILVESKSLMEDTLKNSIGLPPILTKNFIFDFTTDFSYLLFLSISSLKKLLNYCHAQHSMLVENALIDKLEEVVIMFQSVHPLVGSSLLKEVQEDAIKKMIFIIDSKLKGWKDAVELCLFNIDLLNNISMLSCLERNLKFISQKHFVKLLSLSILDKELKHRTRQIQIFFTACEALDISDQQEILQMLLNRYGLITALKLPEFIPEVTALLNQTVKISEAGPQVVALFLQSPHEMMERIISKAIDNSGQISLLVQMLQLVAPVCKYQQSPDSPQLLVNTLKEYLTENLSSTQFQNVVNFVQQLLQGSSGEELFQIEELLLYCILPHLKTSSSPLMIKCILQVLQMVCEKSLQSADQNSWMKGVSIASIMLCLYQLLDHCIIECCGHRKRMVVTILDTFLQIQKQQGASLLSSEETLWLYSHLVKNQLDIMCYVEDFIPDVESWILKSEEEMPLHMLLLHAVRKMDESALTVLKEKLQNFDSSLRYPYLVLCVAQILSHSTLEEWKNLFFIIEQCLESSIEMAKPLQLQVISGTGKMVHVVHLVVDALIVLSKWTNMSQDWPFIFSSLTVSLKVFPEEQTLEVLMQLFSELCRLERALENDHTSQIAVSLLDIASTFNSKVKCSEKPNCDFQVMKNQLTSILQLVKDSNIQFNVLAKLEE